MVKFARACCAKRKTAGGSRRHETRRLPDRRRRLFLGVPARGQPGPRHGVHPRVGHRQPRPAEHRHAPSPPLHAAAVPERCAGAPARAARVRARLGLLGALHPGARDVADLPLRLERTPPPVVPAGRRAPVQRRRTTKRSSSSTTRSPSRADSISTIRRWDTPGARRARARRASIPAGRPYPPMHDVQMMVDGDAAAALGELARARWQRGHGRRRRRRPARRQPAADLWPDGDHARRARRAHRHRPHDAGAFATRPRCRRSRRCAEQSIAAARRFIYIENQYLTSAAVGAALARRLAEPDGPGGRRSCCPREEHGWLEQSSMGVMRARLLRHLLDSDRHGRLRLCLPDDSRPREAAA